MKLFIVISCFTLLIGFSTSKLLIMRYSKLMNYCKLDEDKWEKFVVEKMDTPENLCQELQDSPIFTDESITKEKYLSTKHPLTESKQVVQQTKVFVNFNKIEITTLPCQYNGSTVYLAKHSNCEHLVLFEQQESYIPSISAIAVKPIEFENLPQDRTKEFHILLRQYNSPDGYNAWSGANFIFQEEIKLFQLCMTLLLQVTDKNLAQQTVQLTLSGHGSKKRVKDVIRIHGIYDNDVAKEMGLNVKNYENMDEHEVLFHNYEVPTIQCDTLKASPIIIFKSRITFFFMPQPKPTNNEILFYYKYHNEKIILLYLSGPGPVFSVILKV